MTQEDKELLLKDLCCRLPYHCRVFYEYVDDLDNKTYGYSVTLNTWCIDEINADKATVKPYLRPMSNTTKEELDELKQEHLKDTKLFAECLKNAANGDNSMRSKIIPHFAADWCNKNHFDYRNLIERGLAIDCTGLNIY